MSGFSSELYHLHVYDLAVVLNSSKCHIPHFSVVLIITLSSYIRLLLGAKGTVHVKLCERCMHNKSTAEISGCSGSSWK